MTKKQINVSFILILLLGVVSACYCFPQYPNILINNANKAYSWSIPQIPDNGFKLGLDLKGGVHLEYEADLTDIPEEEKESVMQGLRDLLERRVNTFGVTESIVQVYGQDRVAVELPGVESIESAIEWIGQTPLLEFWEELPEEEIQKMNEVKQKVSEVYTNNKDKTQEEILAEIQKIDNWILAFQSPYQKTELTGRYLKKATLGYDQITYAPIVELQFNDEGAKIFEQVTERNIGKTLAIYLDGASIIDTNGDGKIDGNDLYAPRVNDKISGGQAMISGNMDVKEAKTLVQRLNQGALPVPLGEPIAQKKIGPTLGAVSLTNAVRAGMIGAIMIVVFLILFYRLPGLLAAVALSLYIVILLSLMKLVPVTLTLAGIGGFILSIGMAVDANILIFSRMREELKQGKSVLTSIEEGLKRAWPSIRDGNFTTLIVAFVLYFLGTSFIKAFAFALILGIFVSMFSAVVVTNILLQIFARGRLEKIRFIWS
ncbi:MAG: protein translocase subunit SecD [Candidatus Microsyncoccus archaeolyticus]|nr:MAG: protein translocase subunit SecD [Candidatus Parcubacteria bacterium]